MLCYNATADLVAVPPADPRVTNAVGLALYQLYIYAGVPTVIANAICILVFVSKQKLRIKYPLFATLAVGDLLNGLGMLLAGIFRTRLILNSDYNRRTSFECLRNPWPHFYIIGGQLSSFILFIMGIERIFAVFQPIKYKKYATLRLRLTVIAQASLIAFISLLIGYLCSFLNSDQCVIAICSISNTTGRPYSNYNYVIVIGLPIVALILNIITFIRAKRSMIQSRMQREWHRVQLTLAVCTCSVALIAIPNFLLWGYGRYWDLAIMPYLFIAFCCYSGVNLLVYFIMKKDFRYQLLMLLSFGWIKTGAVSKKSDMRLIQIQPTEGMPTVNELSPASAATNRFSFSAPFPATTKF
uniref:G-protein coupled receptors family 1 profile domain-containing protein n=1 Tax=Plectus sambesii TaxID=2011161 RepID=A0A914VUD1_9BILA